MKERAGFTIVELLVVIAIIGILLTLSIVNLTGNQARVRDEERRGDIANIASNLETFYTSGTNTVTPGGYPGTDQFTSEATILAALRDLEPESLRAPKQTGTGISLVPATNSIQTTTGVLPQPTSTRYVYQPINNSTLCTVTSNKCRQFILYYFNETDGTVTSLKSKYQ